MEKKGEEELKDARKIKLAKETNAKEKNAERQKDNLNIFKHNANYI
jgi:hypothetical protein